MQYYFIALLQVDEIMLTLKQAFSVAALHQNAKTQSQQCDSCPMQQLHKLCERIEGKNLSSKLWLVVHLHWSLCNIVTHKLMHSMHLWLYELLFNKYVVKLGLLAYCL